MPLARIITDSADDSLELSMQLRARGFLVETVPPGEVPSTPADLEVRLEECASEDVVSRAAAKDSEELWVFVAPGALDESMRPMRVIPLYPQIKPRVPGLVVQRAEAPTPSQVRAPEPEDDPILLELEQAKPRMAQPISIASLPQKNEATAADVPPRVLQKPAIVPTPSPLQARAEEVPSKIVALPKKNESQKRSGISRVPEKWQIPEVPERAKILVPGLDAKPSIPARKTAYKIALRISPGFWRTASATIALAVLACILVIMVGLQPPVPAAASQVHKTERSAFPLAPATGTASVAKRRSPPATSIASGRGTHVASVEKKAAPNAPKIQRRQHSAPDEGIIAEDTVVFFDRHTAPSAAKRLPPAPVKRYSDVN
jgi:hypothetical protein